MLDSCLRPEMAAEITLQPVRRHGVDAGIFFSDIVVPARQAGLRVEIQPGVGPVFEHPIRTEADVDALPPLGDAYEERSEEHTSELQSRGHLVCRLLLEKKKAGLNT